MKLLLEAWNKYLLLELNYEDVSSRLDSNKFINSCKYHGISHEKAKQKLLETVPDDIEDSEKANYLNWRIKQFMVNGTIEGPTPKYVEEFYQIKANNLDRILTKNDINEFDSVEEFEKMMESSSKKWLDYQKKKKESTVQEKDINKIYEDDEWTVYIPESKEASCKLGTGTRWCTASRGERNYYHTFHKYDDPLIIFISKENPEEKYQFSYGSEQFMDKEDKSIHEKLLFFKLNEIVKNLKDKLPRIVISRANLYNFKQLEDGGYVVKIPNKTEYYNRDGKLHREDGPAIEWTSGAEHWYQNGKRHRLDGPAVIGPDGTKHWYQNGERHRLDGPAIEWVDGGKEWYQNDKRHRLDGPAVEHRRGDKFWYQNGQLHREDGPAVEEPGGNKEWYLFSKKYPSKKDWEKAKKELGLNSKKESKQPFKFSFGD